MQNENRLIDDFKKQTENTIWKHLDRMAGNYSVYCTHLNGLAPFLTDYDIYLYCNDTNVVVVCLDSCGNGERLTYKESVTLSSLLMSNGSEPRISVVWKLAEAVRHIKNCLQDTDPSVNVFGLLLTEANILNSMILYRMWDAHDVMVIDCLNRLKNREIEVNNYENDYLPCKKYVQAILDACHTAVKPEEPATDDRGPSKDDDDDKYAKLLDWFLRNDTDDDDDDDDEDDEEDEEEETPDEEEATAESGENPSPDEGETDPDDDSSEESNQAEDDTSTDVQFPYGGIDQNNDLSVKVEILRPIANPREELDKLVGCVDIKRRMDELVALTSYNKMMHELFPGRKRHDVSLHSVFLGRPGTGKTTVCKIFGSLLRQAGALTKGHVVVCDRGTFIGTLWGDEERSMRQVLEIAKGGVLMIDEAYLLNGKNANDPGKLVVQLLMNILADETQRDIAVVLCGYKDPMMKMLESNPGLQSRFPNKFEFTDFTVDELLEITRRRVKDYDYQFTIQAWEKYCDMLKQAFQVRNPETWGNARFISNQLERIYIQHATRCVRCQPKNNKELLVITPEDIVPIEIPRQKPKIGF